VNGADPSRPSRSISVVDPLSAAFEWTKRVLFGPFRIEKWLVIGFCAWLSRLGQGGGGGGPGGANWKPSDDLDGDISRAGEWLMDNLPLVILLGAILLIVVVALIVLITWLSSRGKFMFLENVLRDRAAVVEPWKRFRGAGNSVFLFRLILGLSALVFFTALGVGVILAIVGATRAEQSAGPAISILILTFLLVVPIAIALALVGLFLNDFVVPIVYLRDQGVIDGWRVFGNLLSPYLGPFILYVLVRIGIVVFAAILTIVVTCCTCCIAALPYVGTVILLPLHVFVRSYSIFFLSQFGPDYAPLAVFSAAPDAPAPTAPPAVPF
jgi:hypothetical protein